MQRWEHDVTHLTRAEIMGAIKCSTWQDFRLWLKGKPTIVKLQDLDKWLQFDVECNHCDRATRQIQVDNYINALKRGGQLDLEGNVVR